VATDSSLDKNVSPPGRPESDAAALVLSQYEIDPMRGFLPVPDPLDCLPGEFSAWEEAAKDLPKILMTDNPRRILRELPVLDATLLRNKREKRRAMVILSFLGHAYVWGEKEAVSSIAPSLAVPWYQVSRDLGRPPVLSYASYALDNWKRAAPSSPIALGNIALLQNFLGGQDEEWFVLIHVAIEAKAGPVLAAILGAQRAVTADDPNSVADHLEIIARGLDGMNEILHRMPERCEPYIYFNRVRPYIHGWANHPSLPEGMIYEGVKEYGQKPQQFRGETGAQSSIIPSLDAGLGIAHAEDLLRTYLNEMRDYMPPEHRRFISDVERGPSVREYVKRNWVRQPLLREAYNAAVAGVERFRSTHLEYAHSYIIKQSRGGKKNPNYVGTGGTPFGPYLKKHRDETRKHYIK
jgi:indoleamine 2,3-dioxygenase